MKKELSLLLLLGIVVVGLYFAASFTELFFSDAMEYAEIGRNIAQGGGFFVNSVFPIRLAYEHGRAFPFASLRRPPLLPYFESFIFRVTGANDFWASFSTVIFYIALIPLIYLIGTELFKERKIAILSSLFFILNGTALYYAISALTEMPFAFFITLAFYFLLIKRNNYASLALGAALGLAQLTRPNAVLYLPLVLGALMILEKKGRKLKSAALAALAFALLWLPLLAYNYRQTGSPFFSLYSYDLLMGTKFYPVVLDIFRGFEKIDVAGAVMADPAIIVKKFAYGMYKFQNTFPQLLGRYFTAFFVISIFRYHKDRKVVTARALLYFLICAQAALSSLTIFDIRYCFAFLPLAIIFSTEALWYIVKEANPFFRRHRSLSSAVLIVVMLFLMAPTAIQAARNVKDKFILGRNPESYTPADAYRKTGELVRQGVPQGRGFVASDIGWVSAWYGERLSVKLPIDVGGLKTIEEKSGIPVKAVLLSTDGDHWNEYSSEWKEVLYNDEDIPGYKKAGIFARQDYKALLFVKE